MATLTIIEYERMATDGNGNVIAVGAEPNLAVQKITFTPLTPVQSAAFNAKTRFIWIETDAVCTLLFGDDPTASAADQPLGIGSALGKHLGVIPGQKVSVQ